MDVRLSLSEGAPDALDDLRVWLQREPELRGRVRSTPSPPESGRMTGGAPELALFLAAGGGAAVSRCVTAWLRQRTSDVRIEIRRVDGDSVKVVVDRISDVDRVLARVLDDREERMPPERAGEAGGDGHQSG